MLLLFISYYLTRFQGGKGFLSRYEGSLVKALREILPELQFIESKFLRVSGMARNIVS